MKLRMSENQVKKNREIYKIEPKKLKKIINECFCKHVTKKENYIKIFDFYIIYNKI